MSLFEEGSHTHDQAIWVSRMADFACRKLKADWLIHSDADEFWWCDKSSIRDGLAECPDSYRALRVERSNFLPPVGGIHSADGAFWDRQLRRQVESVNSLGRPLPPKCVTGQRRTSGLTTAIIPFGWLGALWQLLKPTACRFSTSR